jgi:hypothetical protein
VNVQPVRGFVSGASVREGRDVAGRINNWHLSILPRPDLDVSQTGVFSTVAGQPATELSKGDEKNAPMAAGETPIPAWNSETSGLDVRGDAFSLVQGIVERNPFSTA